MLERLALPNIRQALLKMMGVPQSQSLNRLDHRLTQLEKNISAWADRVEKAAQVVQKKVLLADIEPGSFEALRAVLPGDLQLKMVKDWDQLFRETRKAQVPLVVIDLALFGQEGMVNIKKLRDHNPDVKIVALSNYLSETLAQAMPEGLELAGILQKPLHPESLSAHLERYLV
ncbi:MAG: response regulator [bacterium]